MALLSDQTLEKILQKLLPGRFFEGQERTVKLKKNVVGLFLLRGIAVAINFVLVPLTLAYLNTDKERYGIWMTLSSLLLWITFFDIGLGNGLRHRLGAALARGEEHEARIYISTTYAAVGAITIGFALLYALLTPVLRWSSLLNAPATLGGELAVLAAILFLVFCIRMVAGLFGTILMTLQRPALSTLLEVSGSALALGGVGILTFVVPDSLVALGTVMGAAPVLVLLVASLWFFGGRYSRFRPSLRFVRWSEARGLLDLGFKFFLLQVSALLIFSSSNLIISHVLAPSEVTPFSIASRYFGIPLTISTILLTPIWSATTEAYVQGDTGWTSRAIRRFTRLWLWQLPLVAVMLLVADPFYRFWVGPDVPIPFELSAALGVYTLIFTWNGLFGMFINGTGKVLLQTIAALLTSALAIGLGVLFAGPLHLGSAGVVLATALALLPGTILWPIQMRRLLNGTARGVWDR